MNEDKTSLAQNLATLLSEMVAAGFIAHGYHWNVKGSDFREYHDFFGAIYEDYDSTIDPIAENIRKLGFDSPYFLTDFVEMATHLADQPRLSGDPVEMLESLASINSHLIECTLAAFTLANQLNEQGIANYLAERDDILKKWQWQLESTLGIR
jgi:starvation-inducible DNA-binding protein